MSDWRRRIGWSLVVLALVVLFYTLFYRWAMFAFEDVRIGFFESLQFVVEAFTTAGFGGDSQHWNTPAMNLVVVAMNVTGVVLVFLALPLFVVPLFQEALEESPRESTDFSDHVIICSYNSRENVLRSELEAAEVPYVVIDDDPETIVELNDSGIEAIRGDPETEAAFRSANIHDARALVADVSDEVNVSVILTARELREDLQIVSVAETERDASYHRDAGADRVIRPRQVLGRALANKATSSITSEFRETVELGDDFTLSELLVKENSDLAGQTVAELGLRDQIGASVIGMWSNGEFVPVPEPDMRIDENSILLVAGSPQALKAVNSRTISRRPSGRDRVVVAGYGVVGRSVVEVLREEGIDHTVVDSMEADGVDLVGDVIDRDVLAAAAVDEARIVVLALDDDTTTVYSTVAIEELAPDTDVLARSNDVENTAKLYRAGAEYVLSLSTVTGRMLSSVLLEDEEILTPGTQVAIIRTAAPELVGQTLEEAAIGDRTGATVVAIERNGDLLTNPGPDSTVRTDDVLIIAGSDEAVNRFVTTFK